jgi:hypothetical protein
MRETQLCVLLHVTSRRSRDHPYCCAIQRLQRRLETPCAERSERRGNIANYCCAIAFRGFCVSTSPAWGDYATLRTSITVAVRSKAWTVFERWNIGIVGSNPTQGMDVRMHLFCVCAVLCVGIGFATGWSPVQGVLSTVCRIKELKNRPKSNKGLQNHRQIEIYTLMEE